MCENIYFEFIQSFFKRFIEERAFQHSRFPSLPFQKKKLKCTRNEESFSKKKRKGEKVWNAVRSEDEEKDRFDAAIISQTPITWYKPSLDLRVRGWRSERWSSSALHYRYYEASIKNRIKLSKPPRARDKTRLPRVSALRGPLFANFHRTNGLLIRKRLSLLIARRD